MRTLLSVLSLLLLLVVSASAQTARVQIIHNSPDPTVDIYANGLKVLEDFAFRTATPFIDLPAGIGLTVAVAPASSTSAADAIATFPVTFESGKTYAITASGIVGDMDAPFTLIADDNARETAANPAKVDLNVLHGSPDAPAVDVVVRTGGKIVSNAAYGDFTPYLSVDPGLYYLDVKPAGSNAIVQTFRADLSGLAGQAVRVFASGLLTGTPGFGLYAALANGTVVELPASPVARVQVIHNSPSPTVDVWANEDLLIDNFEYRTATPFIFVPAGVDIDLGIALDTSTSAASSIATFPVNLENGKTYVVAASGIVGDAATPFTLIVNDNGREVASDTGNVDIAVLHGSTNAPAVDVDAVLLADNVITSLAYGNFTPYLGLAPDKYDFAIRAAGNPDVVASFRADLSGLKGGAAYVFASGLLGGDPAFGLFAALPNGTVLPLPLTPTARVQVIHNSPEPVVDVYAGNTLLLNDFAFRTATPFVNLPADRIIQLGVAPEGSTSPADAIATFEAAFETGKSYAITAVGVVGDAGRPFTVVVDAEAREAAADPAKVDFNVLHGSPDAPAVDIDVQGVGNIISNLSYPEQTDYLSVDPESYILQVRPAGAPDIVASFRADLTSLAGGAARVFASGFLNGTPAFGLFAALPNGAVVEFPAIAPPPATALLQVIHNSPSPTVDIYANDDLLIDDFVFRTATEFIEVPANVAITIGVAPENSQSAADAIATFPVTFEEGKIYVATAVGVVGDPGRPFTLVLDAEARDAAEDPLKVEFNVLHGSPDAPAVDIDVVGLGNVITDLAYPEQTGYLSVDPDSYVLQIRPAGAPDIVASFRADLSSLAGGAARVFASGFLNGTPAFGLFAALADGTVVEFPPLTPPPATALVQIIHNSPSPTVDIYANDDLLIDDFAFRTATEFIEVPANVAITIGVAPENSQSAGDAIATFPVTFEEGRTYVVTASGVVGSTSTPFTLIVNDNGRDAAEDPDQVDIAILHGSTNAPAVDVDAVFVANDVVTGLAYGSFTPYLSLTPDVYDFAVRAAGDPNVVASFRADLSGLKGGAAYVFASGLLGGNPGFGLFAALADGTVLQLPLTPTTRVQVIHNSPEPTVDIYAGNTLLLNDFAFRTATPYIDFPADRNVAFGVAPAGSTSASDAIATFNASFNTGSTYMVAASGVVGSTTTPFTLIVDADAAETAAPGTVGVSVLHGSPDAPAVDVAERLGGTLVADLAYGEFTPYLAIPAADGYYLDIKPTGSDQILATYRADLSGLTGQAVRVFASGFLGGTPGFGLYVALPNGAVAALPLELVARVQVIHNAPAPSVDVYANGFLLLDNFEFLDATPFGYLPAGIPIELSVAPENSTSEADAFFNATVTLENGKTYAVVASGINGNATTPFTLIVNDEAREQPEDDSKIELAILHGVPNAPAVNLVSLTSGAPIVTDLAYGTFLPYISLDPDVLLLDVVPSASPNTVVGTWGADLSGVPGLTGIVMASGLLGDDPEIDLVLVLPNGFVLSLPSFARAQIIHNSPGAAAAVVDAYLDDELALDNLGFREATGFGLLPARTPFDLSVAPGNSTSVDDAIYTLSVDRLETGKSYIIMAAGVVGSPTTPFDLYLNENGRLRAENGANVDLILFHGSTDAPEVDVKLATGSVLFDNLEFGEYSDYVSVPPAEYIVQVTPANDNNTVVQSYRADVSALGGGAATIFASGFLGGGQPAFEVWVALPDGTTFPLPVFVNTNELAANLNALQLAPNPAIDNVLVRFNMNQSEALRYGIRDLSGRLVAEGDFGLVPEGEFAQKLDLSGMPSGMYQLEIVSDGGVQVQKFIVQGR